MAVPAAGRDGFKKKSSRQGREGGCLARGRDGSRLEPYKTGTRFPLPVTSCSRRNPIVRTQRTHCSARRSARLKERDTGAAALPAKSRKARGGVTHSVTCSPFPSSAVSALIFRLRGAGGGHHARTHVSLEAKALPATARK
jgi:hypothetical protein